MTRELFHLTRGSISKKPLRLLELKNEGHDLIDSFVGDGIPRVKVYRRLAKRLGVSENRAHFGEINTIPEAERAVETLRRWKLEREMSKAFPPNPPGSRKKKSKGEVLSWPEQQKALAELRRHREEKGMSIWRRWIRKVGSYTLQRKQTLANETERE